MKAKYIVLAVAFVLLTGTSLFAQRQLQPEEILQIIEQLTNQPIKTWISAGTIQATHQQYKAPKMTDPAKVNQQVIQKTAEYQNNPNKIELDETLQKMNLDAMPFNTRYKLSNEYTMTSLETVKIEGEKFYWQIDVQSRTDSVKPGKELQGNYMAENFNMDWNAKRIFAWDGEKYTMYSLPVNGAVVDAKGSTPRSVNGPLTAGIIPWGYGYYSYENLAAKELTAIEQIIDGNLTVNLTIHEQNAIRMQFVLDPAKNYAAISYTINYGPKIVTKQYSDHQLISGNWVPRTILLEKTETATNRLLSRDLWNITVIDTNVPPVEQFNVEYQNDASIEFFSYITPNSIKYRYSDTVDNDKLLSDKLAFAANQGTIPQNCATASIKYVAEKLGKNASSSQLSDIVNTDNTSSLLAIKQYAENLGLHCRAVKTDIKTLLTLSNCQIILHIPHKNHFVVLDSIDSNFARIIDLSSNNFYYLTDVSFFNMDWTQGTALLVSNQNIEGQFEDIQTEQLQNITGAAGYACTKLLQPYGELDCQPLAGECLSDYIIFYERFGCETAFEGSCLMNWQSRRSEAPCFEDLYDPFMCNTTGEFSTYYMKACNF